MIDDMILDAAEKLFGAYCTPQLINEAESGAYPAAFWQATEASRLLLSLVPEDAGGADGSLALGMKLAKLCGEYAVPTPFVETLLANWLLVSSGLAPVEDSATFTFAGADATVRNETFSGRLTNVPFACHVRQVVVMHEESGRLNTIMLATNGRTLTHGTNLAGESRDTLDIRNNTIIQNGYMPDGTSLQQVKALAALLRASQTVGALQEILGISLTYVQERQQFGRPIGKFQLVQAMLVDIAAEAAAVGAAVDGAVSNILGRGLTTESMLAIAVAKIAAGAAAGVAARAAHQAHGAMGFSLEYPLQQYTRRIWAWRDEYGSESEWARWLAYQMADQRQDSLWSAIVKM